jgi:hypothetical protein
MRELTGMSCDRLIELILELEARLDATESAYVQSVGARKQQMRLLADLQEDLNQARAQCAALLAAEANREKELADSRRDGLWAHADLRSARVGTDGLRYENKGLREAIRALREREVALRADLAKLGQSCEAQTRRERELVRQSPFLYAHAEFWKANQSGKRRDPVQSVIHGTAVPCRAIYLLTMSIGERKWAELERFWKLPSWREAQRWQARRTKELGLANDVLDGTYAHVCSLLAMRQRI